METHLANRKRQAVNGSVSPGTGLSRHQEGRLSVGSEAAGKVLVSVVSHAQASLAARVLEDLEHQCTGESMEVVFTVNVPEELPNVLQRCSFPIRVVHNQRPKGFAANHNAAFAMAGRNHDFFCVVNPDIRLTSNPLPALKRAAAGSRVGIAAPAVRTPEGHLADSARRIPTPRRLIGRYIRPRERRLEYPPDTGPARPEWVAGMCMLMRSSVYQELGGFDEKFFLYLEDVDLCLRSQFRGYEVVVSPDVEVTHDARRQSHRHPRYLLWHLSSLLRFYASPVFLRYLLQGSSPD